MNPVRLHQLRVLVNVQQQKWEEAQLVFLGELVEHGDAAEQRTQTH